MIRALADRRVDFVLHWASCAETFSFSTHEALAAGAYVLTNAGSGNVAATVRRLDRGAVLASGLNLRNSSVTDAPWPWHRNCVPSALRSVQ